MIGFLCNSEDIVSYYTSYYNSFKPIIHKGISILFFTIDNIDLKNRKVQGVTASSSGIKKGEFQIPKVIFNFSKHYKKANIKKLKLLCEKEEIKIINETNKFNQIMIMDILSSFNSTKKYILNYNNSSENNTTECNFLIMPKFGSSFYRMIYIEQSNTNFEADNISKWYGSEENQIQNKITMPSNKTFFIECPKLKTFENNLSTTRIFLQKGSKNMWKYLYSSTNLSEDITSQDIMNDLKTISMKAISYINSYIPSLGICFIDFIFDENMNPYFLHFGGWNKKLLYEKENEILYKEFCDNLIKCYEHYSSESQED